MQDKVHAAPGPGGAYLEDVEGFTSASPRQSLVTAAGALRLDPIEGVRYRLARPVSHHHGVEVPLLATVPIAMAGVPAGVMQPQLPNAPRREPQHPAVDVGPGFRLGYVPAHQL